jgi:signal transduction histidine kinase
MMGRTLGPIGDLKYLEYASDINNSGHHLLDLINGILDLSKIEAGKFELREANIDVLQLLKFCISMVGEQAKNNEVDIAPDIAPDLPPLFADELKCRQILVNILSNAVKFTPSGGKVKINIWFRREKACIFQITDTGIGIAAADIQKALTPFQQIDGELNRKYAGTGLGLPLAKSLVELHGGSLELHSEIGVGTTVTIRFPAHRIAPQSACELDSENGVRG